MWDSGQTKVLFEHHSVIIDDDELKRYSKNWHKPAVAKDLEKSLNYIINN